MSRQELSERSGLSLSTVYRIENLTSDARQSSAKKIGEALGGFSVEELSLADVERYLEDTEFDAEARPTAGAGEHYLEESRERLSKEMSDQEFRASVIERLDSIISILERDQGMGQILLASAIAPFDATNLLPLLLVMRGMDKTPERGERRPESTRKSRTWPRRTLEEGILNELQEFIQKQTEQTR